eukprot:3581709-Rhodomonas_salina.1
MAGGGPPCHAGHGGGDTAGDQTQPRGPAPHGHGTQPMAAGRGDTKDQRLFGFKPPARFRSAKGTTASGESQQPTLKQKTITDCNQWERPEQEDTSPPVARFWEATGLRTSTLDDE